MPKKLIRFAFPLFLAKPAAGPLQCGGYAGGRQNRGRTTGLAAISNASMLCFIINSLCIGLTMGGAFWWPSTRAQATKRDSGTPSECCSFCRWWVPLLVTILGLAIHEPSVPGVGCSGECLSGCLRLYGDHLLGTVFVFGYNTVCSILKGWAIPKRLSFRRCRHDSQRGAGCASGWAAFHGHGRRSLATITAQGVSFMGSLVYLRRYQPGFLPRKIGVSSGNPAGHFEGGPATAIQMVVVNTAYLLVTGCSIQFGTPVAAASGVGLKDQHLCRDALLGHRSGNNRHGGPVFGAWPN